jgi:hypothetical protein
VPEVFQVNILRWAIKWMQHQDTGKPQYLGLLRLATGTAREEFIAIHDRRHYYAAIAACGMLGAAACFERVYRIRVCAGLLRRM